MSDLVKRLREPDWHDPKCPFEKYCYCEDDAPHDRVRHSDAIDAADRIEALEARVAAADKLAEAGSVMSRALQGNYIVPGSAAKWDAALAAYEATKEQSDG